MSGQDFWSLRRAKVDAEARAEDAAARADLAEKQQAEADALSDEEVLRALDLPDPDQMDSPDQVQALLKAVAPERLKRRALRRLWRMNPILANVDGLVDYGEDFTDSATVIENMQTAYQVGKGMLKHIEALAAEAEAQAQADQDEAAEEEKATPSHVDLAEDTSPEAETLPTAPQAPPPQTEPAVLSPETDPHSVASLTPRRMRFQFDTAT